MSDFQILELRPRATAVVGAVVAFADLTRFFGRAFTEVAAALDSQGIPVTGPPVALYRGEPTDKVTVEAGFPVDVPVRPVGDVVPGELPGGRVASTVHVGPYGTLAATYEALRGWLAGRDLKPGPDMWEEYLDGPDTNPDPAAWRTRIMWPVS